MNSRPPFKISTQKSENTLKIPIHINTYDDPEVSLSALKQTDSKEWTIATRGSVGLFEDSKYMATYVDIFKEPNSDVACIYFCENSILVFYHKLITA